MVCGKIDWEKVNAALPYKRGEDQLEERRKLWRAIDVSGSGLLSLAKVTRGIRDVVGLDLLFDCRPAINRAFHYSKDLSKKRGGAHTADYLVFKEFRVFLQALRQFFEFYQAFEWLDKTQDRRISRQEFTSLSVRSTIEKWVGPIQDWDAEFDCIVGDEGDQVLFSQFVDWALERNLDMEMEDDI